jgi:hypothetical protein
MKHILLIAFASMFVLSCKKEKQVVKDSKKEGTLSYIEDTNCGYLLWVEDGRYKIENESLLDDSYKSHIYTLVAVEYELLNSQAAITCPIYTEETQTQQVRLISISKR